MEMQREKEYTPVVLSATSLIGTPVTNSAGEDMGKVEELMLDFEEGRISYAVISFGGFLGINDKYFAIPWGLLRVDTDNEKIIFNIDRKVLEHGPGFDKDHWPQIPSREWLANLYLYYDTPRYW